MWDDGWCEMWGGGGGVRCGCEFLEVEMKRIET